MPFKYYLVYDPLEHSVETYDDRNLAINAAEAIIQVARGIAFDQARWPAWVADVCVGHVELVAAEIPGDDDINGGVAFVLAKPR